MAESENQPNADNPGAKPAPSLDESLTQLEHALDLFVQTNSNEQYGETHILSPLESPSISKLKSELPVMPDEQYGETQLIHEAAVTPGLPKLIKAENNRSEAQPRNDLNFELELAEIKKKISNPEIQSNPQFAGADVVAYSEDDEEAKTPRFPIFTDGQKKMIWIALAFVIFFVLIGFLIWQRQKNDELRFAAEHLEEERFRNVPMPTGSSPASTISEPLTLTDKSLADHVTQILTAYNPTSASSNYKIQVADGVVTLTGEVNSQLEKDGAENVIQPLTGIKKIVNNLTVKNTNTPGGTLMTANGPVMYPKVNDAEARRLEEALRRDLAEGAKRAEEERIKIEQQNQRLMIQRVVEETGKVPGSDGVQKPPVLIPPPVENPLIRQPEDERARREKEAAERRQEEQRRIETERNLKTESARQDHNIRVGTVAWQGVIKGVEDVVIRGGAASLQHVSGDMPFNVRASFSDAIPGVPLTVRLVAASGPSPIRIIQQPSAANNFTTIVRIGDGKKADSKPHSFTLRWATQ